MSRAGRATLLLALVLAGASVAPAAAEARLALIVGTRDTGWIGLRLHGTPGVPVTIDEEDGGRIAELTPRRGRHPAAPGHALALRAPHARFIVTAADGETAVAEVRTPSCATRLVVVAPRSAGAGSIVRARVVDRWRTGGLRVRVCVEPPGGPAQCRRTRLRPGCDRLRVPFEALRPGGWRVSARTRYGRAVRDVRASNPGGRLTVLATGDSMMQRLDGLLARRLSALGVGMRSDAHEATGISKPSVLDWEAYAHSQAASHPDVVVMFIGANDSFTMGSAVCCGEAWIAEYARRARSMMAAYARGGRTRVLWLNLPTPREGFFRQSFPAVNAALRRAAATLRRDVHVVDLVKVFSPGGRYRKWIRRGDREVGVRQADGVHLSDEGAAIAAKVITRTLQRERVLP